MAPSKQRGGNAVSLIDQPEGDGERSPAAEEARIYKHWSEELRLAKKENEDFLKRGKDILSKYKDSEKKRQKGGAEYANNRMNILWSNIETLKPALYGKDPQPNVSRRFMDSDPVSRTASMILERCLITQMELAEFGYPMMRARDDLLLPGRGIVWVRFNPTMGMKPMREPLTAIPLAGTGRTVYRALKGGQEIPQDQVKTDDEGLPYYETEPEEQILAYGLDLNHVVWSDFLHEPVNDWTQVTWVAKRLDMKRPRLIKEFGDKGRQVNLNKQFNAKRLDDDDGSDRNSTANCAEVWEIWDKAHNKVFWVTDGLPDAVLKVEDDPLGLHDFWPVPRPLLATTTTDSLIPVPDYALYQDQATQLDRLTDRIRLLIDALRVVGVYNAEMTSLQNLLNETGENEMLGVDTWMTFAQSGGLKGNLDWLPIDQIAAVLTQLFQARAQIKNDLYEITGMSDVIRGATNPEETATAQQIKANFGNLRLQARQSEMARFARDTLRKMAEVMAEHFAEEALIEMSGIQSLDEFKPSGDPQKDAASAKRIRDAVALLKSDKLRTFKIDIETDATVAADQQKEKETRVEFLQAVAPFLEKAAVVGQQAPQFVPLLIKMLDFGVKGFRAGRTLEAAIEETIQTVERMQAEAKANPQGPPPDPVAQAQAEQLQARTAQMQEELKQLQAKAVAAQAEAQVKAQENLARSNEMREKARADMARLAEDLDMRRKEHEKTCLLLELQIAKAEFELEQLRMNGGVAEIQAMIPKDQPAPQPTQQELETHTVDLESRRAEARLKAANAKVAELRAQLAEVRMQQQGLDGLAEALGGDDGVAPKPAEPPTPSERNVQFVRDETGQLSGAKISG